MEISVPVRIGSAVTLAITGVAVTAALVLNGAAAAEAKPQAATIAFDAAAVLQAEPVAMPYGIQDRRGGATRARRIAPVSVPALPVSPMPAPAGPVVTATGSLQIVPSATTLAPNDTVKVTVSHIVTSSVVGTQAELRFDPRLLEVVDVAPAAPYRNGLSVLGRAPQTGAGALAAANTTGRLLMVAFYTPDVATQLPAGPQPFMELTLKAKPGVSGTAALTLGDSVVLLPVDPAHCTPELDRLPVTGASITVTGSGAPVPSAWPAAAPDAGQMVASCVVGDVFPSSHVRTVAGGDTGGF